MTTLRSGSCIDVGRRRKKQDDSLLEEDGLFAVADGMGGHVGGDVASLTAIEALRAAYGNRRSSDALIDAIEAANTAVWEKASADPGLRTMGTTLVAAALVEEGDEEMLVIASVGDSRVYLMRDGELSQLTEDHNVVAEMLRAGQLTEEEAAVHPDRNRITRVIGVAPSTEPDVQNLVPYRGDRLMLCSDGLTNEVDEDEIASVLRRFREPDDAARELVARANANGGNDNITVLIVDVVDDDDRSAVASRKLENEPPSQRLLTNEERNAELRSISRRDDDEATPSATSQPIDDDFGAPSDVAVPRRVTFRLVAFLLLLLIVLGGAVAATAWYARGAYFVGFDEGRVTIFKGRPGGLLWFKPTVEERTDITQASVRASRAADLEAGKEEPTIDDARRYVDNLREESGLDDSASTTDTTESPPTSAATTSTADSSATSTP